MDNQILLSLCIPTNGIVEYVIPVIDSIYSQNIDPTLFEVVITDNGGKDALKEALESRNFSNLHYYKTSSSGFTNQIDAFEKCSGLFCKMLNHRSRMLPGSINNLLNLIEKYKDEKPIIYCAEGRMSSEPIIECENLDEFVRNMSYWISWSAGTGAWRSDISNIRDKSINVMFPHTVFLFELRHDSKYVIWNGTYEVQASDKGKGGYDVFQTFGVTLLDLLSDLRIKNRISLETFITVKKGLLRYLRKIYLEDVVLPTKHTYIIENVRIKLSVYYGVFEYWKIVSWSLCRVPYALLLKGLIILKRQFSDRH